MTKRVLLVSLLAIRISVARILKISRFEQFVDISFFRFYSTFTDFYRRRFYRLKISDRTLSNPRPAFPFALESNCITGSRAGCVQRTSNSSFFFFHSTYIRLASHNWEKIRSPRLRRVTVHCRQKMINRLQIGKNNFQCFFHETA